MPPQSLNSIPNGRQWITIFRPQSINEAVDSAASNVKHLAKLRFQISLGIAFADFEAH